MEPTKQQLQVKEPRTHKRVRSTGYDFSKSMEIMRLGKTFGRRTTGAISLDFTLSNLFETLTVEYSGVTPMHPQWKHFRHTQMVINDQIRLGNGIWRVWHMQFEKGLLPNFSCFDIDPTLPHHKRQEAVVLEGKYWKRKQEGVATEYRKWRFYSKKLMKSKPSDPWLDSVREKAVAVFDELNIDSQPQAMQVDPIRPNIFPSLDDFPETLFMSSPREPFGSLPYSSFMDVMQQPNLDNLNPSLSDLLDRLEPMDVMLPRSSAAATASGSSNSYFQTPLPPPPPLQANPIQPSSFLSSAAPSQQRQPQQQSTYPQPLSSPVQTHPTTPLPNAPQHSDDSMLPQYSDKPRETAPTPPQLLFTNQLPPPPPSSSAMGGGYNNSSQGDRQFPVSPSSFLSMPTEPAKGRQARQLESSMELGGNGNYAMKPEPLMDSAGTPCANQERQTVFDMDSFPTPQQPSSSRQTLQQDSYQSINRSNVMTSPESIYGVQPPAMVDSLQHQQKNAEESSSSSDPPLFRTFINQFFPSESQPQQPPPPPHPVHSPSQPGSKLAQMQRQSSGDLTPNSGVFQFPSSPSPIQQQQQRQTQFEGGASSVSPLHTSPLLQQHSRPDMPPPSQPFVRVSSAGNLGVCAESPSPRPPPLERGRSEPTFYLQEQVRKLTQLTEQQEHQMKEIEKQQQLAHMQYSEILKQFVQHSTGKPSEEQQQVLQSVLADPNLVSFLQSFFGGLAGRTLTSPPPGKLAIAPSPAKVPPLLPSPPHPVFKVPAGMGDFPSPEKTIRFSPDTNFSNPGKASASEFFSPGSVLSNYPTIGKASGSEAFPQGSVYMPMGDGMAGDASAQMLQKKFKSIRNLTSGDKEVYRELRRQSHITAEQKRRGNIKSGFDQLQSLVVNVSAYPSGKVSKTIILEKTLEYIRHVHQERDEREQKMDTLKKEIEQLTTTIARCQEQLPASGVPVTRQRFEENRQRFREYVQRNTLQNYKFWVFGVILQQLFESYNSMVSTGSMEELCHTVEAWFDQNCNLPSLRPVVMNSLRELSMKTSILTNPSELPQQLTQYAKQEFQQQQQQQHPAFPPS